jgi:hypothetical protein
MKASTLHNSDFVNRMQPTQKLTKRYHEDTLTGFSLTTFYALLFSHPFNKIGFSFGF